MFVSFHTNYLSFTPTDDTEGVASFRDNGIDFLQLKGGSGEGSNYASGYYHSELYIWILPSHKQICLGVQMLKAFRLYRNTLFLTFNLFL